MGDDLINMDDDQTTAGGRNNQPDTATSYEGVAHGGAGRDVLIGNTGGDRLSTGWVSSSYLVPFSPSGAATGRRALAPEIVEGTCSICRNSRRRRPHPCRRAAPTAARRRADGDFGMGGTTKGFALLVPVAATVPHQPPKLRDAAVPTAVFDVALSGVGSFPNSRSQRRSSSFP